MKLTFWCSTSLAQLSLFSFRKPSLIAFGYGMSIPQIIELTQSWNELYKNYLKFDRLSCTVWEIKKNICINTIKKVLNNKINNTT